MSLTSGSRHRNTGPTPRIRDLVRDRDQHACAAQVPDHCTGRAEQIHHRRARGMGGTRRPDTNSPANLLTVCACCHAWITLRPLWGHAHGWVLTQHDDPGVVPLTWRGERVTLTHDGRTRPVT